MGGAAVTWLLASACIGFVAGYVVRRVGELRLIREQQRRRDLVAPFPICVLHEVDTGEAVQAVAIRDGVLVCESCLAAHEQATKKARA